MSNMTEYPWTESELNILKKHEEYYKYMVDYKRRFKLFPSPKKPAEKLPVITFKKSNKLLGVKLDEYL